MREYAVVYERSSAGWSAYCPDLPGLASASRTFEETERMHREELELHLEAMLEQGAVIPPAVSRTEMIEVSTPEVSVLTMPPAVREAATFGEIVESLEGWGWQPMPSGPAERVLTKKGRVITLVGSNDALVTDDVRWNVVDRITRWWGSGTERYAAVLQPQREGGAGWTAYLPDLPGLGVAAESLDEMHTKIPEAIRSHLFALSSLHHAPPHSTCKVGVTRTDIVEAWPRRLAKSAQPA